MHAPDPLPSETLARSGSFGKYRQKGAYHWDAISKNPFRHHCFTRARYEVVLEAACIQERENVTDLGCGDGALTYLITKRVRHGAVTGVEPDDVGRMLAQEMLNKKLASVVLLSDIRQIPSSSQNLVICAEVLEHVDQPSLLLAEIYRVLTPTGRVVLSTPVRLTEDPMDRQHVQEFFPSDLHRLISERFEIVSHDFCCPAFAVELYYWRPTFLGKRGIIRIVMNMLSAWFGVQVIRGLAPLDRYYTLQVITARKHLDWQGQGKSSD